MSELRIVFPDTGADLFVGEKHIGTVSTEQDVLAAREVVIPLELFSQADREIRKALDDVLFDDTLKRMWEFLSANYPSVTSFTIEYDSEYNDEGGYFDVARTYFEGDEDETDLITDDGEWWDFEGSISSDFFPEGEYKKP